MNSQFRAWHTSEPSSGENGSTTNASLDVLQPEYVEQDTVNGADMSSAADRVAADAKFARANLATSDKAEKTPAAAAKIAAVDVPASHVPPAEPDNMPLAKSDLEVAIDQCTALGDKLDMMISEKWAKRATPILQKSLKFLEEYEAAIEAERKAVRKSLKAKSSVSREPNIDNLPLIAVYMCVSCADKAQTKAQRKAWGRFKTVVAVAAAASIKPEMAAEWLEKRTLNGILAEWRGMQKDAGKQDRKPPVPKGLKEYTNLAAALAVDSKFQALAKAELLKVDAAIGKAMAKATDAPAFTVASDMPAEKVAANA